MRSWPLSKTTRTTNHDLSSRAQSWTVVAPGRGCGAIPHRPRIVVNSWQYLNDSSRIPRIFVTLSYLYRNRILERHDLDKKFAKFLESSRILTFINSWHSWSVWNGGIRKHVQLQTALWVLPEVVGKHSNRYNSTSHPLPREVQDKTVINVLYHSRMSFPLPFRLRLSRIPPATLVWIAGCQHYCSVRHNEVGFVLAAIRKMLSLTTLGCIERHRVIHVRSVFSANTIILSFDIDWCNGVFQQLKCRVKYYHDYHEINIQCPNICLSTNKNIAKIRHPVLALMWYIRVGRCLGLTESMVCPKCPTGLHVYTCSI